MVPVGTAHVGVVVSEAIGKGSTGNALIVTVDATDIQPVVLFLIVML